MVRPFFLPFFVVYESEKRLVPIPNPEAKWLIADNTTFFKSGNVGNCKKILNTFKQGEQKNV